MPKLYVKPRRYHAPLVLDGWRCRAYFHESAWETVSYLSDQLLIICLIRCGFRQGEMRPPVRSTRFGYRVAQIGFYPSCDPGNVLQLVSRLFEIADLVQ
jgi:hypothetical protein